MAFDKTQIYYAISDKYKDGLNIGNITIYNKCDIGNKLFYNNSNLGKIRYDIGYGFSYNKSNTNKSHYYHYKYIYKIMHNDNLNVNPIRNNIIRKVIIPHDAIITSYIKNNISCYKADKVILGKKENMYDIKNIKEFNFKLNYHTLINICENDCLTGDILDLYDHSYCLEDRIEYCYQQLLKYAYMYSKDTVVDIDSYYDDEEITCLLCYVLFDEYYYINLDYACIKGNISVLEWYFKKEWFPTERNDKEKLLICAAEYGQISVLEWFWTKGLINGTLIYDILWNACICNKKYASNILDWIYSKGPLLHDDLAASVSVDNKEAHDWFKRKSKL